MSPPKKTTPSAPPLREGKESGEERIAKRMARAGLCSRREAEVWVREGRVKVNGKKLVDPAFNVSDKDAIMVDGKLLAAKERTRMWLYHKPRGLVTTHKDPEGRPTVFGALPPELGRVISVGRLDANSEGLLLLTNDGELARRLELPSQGWVRRYRIRIFGKPENLEKLQQGITIDGIRYGSIKAVIDSEKDSNCWLTVSLQEGKNRELRKVFEHLGHPVSRLIRLAYGPFQLSTIERGAVKEVTQKVIKEQLGG